MIPAAIPRATILPAPLSYWFNPADTDRDGRVSRKELIKSITGLDVPVQRGLNAPPPPGESLADEAETEARLERGLPPLADDVTSTLLSRGQESALAAAPQAAASDLDDPTFLEQVLAELAESDDALVPPAGAGALAARRDPQAAAARAYRERSLAEKLAERAILSIIA